MAEIRFLTDEDIKSAILEGVRRRLPNLDIVRVQDVGLRTFRDPRILEFATNEGRNNARCVDHEGLRNSPHHRRKANAGSN